MLLIWHDEPWPLAVTDEHGRLVIGAAPGADHRLLLMAEDGRSEAFELPAARDPVEPVTVTLRPAVLVHGRVEASDGTPLAGAMIWPGNDPAAFSIADPAGRFETWLPATGAWRLQAHAAGYRPAAQRDGGRPVGAPPPGELVLALRPASEISGRVIDGAGRPLAGVRVAATPAADPRDRTIRFDTADGRATSDALGRFTIHRLHPATSYDVSATSPGMPAVVQHALSPAARAPGTPLELVVGTRREIFGRVVDVHDRPLADIAVRVEAASPQRRGAGRRRAAITVSSDASGRFTVADLDAERVDLEATGQGFAPLRVRGVAVASAPEQEPGDAIDLGTLVMVPGVAIRGRVRTIAGEPVAAARIYRSDDLAATLAALEDDDPSEPDSLSDDRGIFEMGGLEADRTVDLLVIVDDFVPVALTRVRAPNDSLLEAIVHPAAVARGTVMTPDGDPVAGAEVSLEREAPSAALSGLESKPAGGSTPFVLRATRSAMTDDQGQFEIASVLPGPITLEAWAEGFRPSENQRRELVAGAPGDPILLVLGAGAEVFGQVIDARAQPVAGAEVAVDRARAHSDAEGRYRLRGAPTGRQLTEVRARGYQQERREVLLVGGESAEVDFVLRRGQPVSGLVVDADGLPLEGVQVVMENQMGGAFEVHAATSDTEGRFSVEAVADGSYQVAGTLEGYVQAPSWVSAVVEGMPVEDLELRMFAGARVEGQITGLDFDALMSVTVVASDGSRNQAGEVDYTGGYRIEGLAPGDYALEASLDGGSREARARVAIEPDTVVIERDLEFGGVTLSGVVLNGEAPLPSVLVTARASHRALERTVTTDADGRFALSDLEPDTYWIALAHTRLGLIHNEDVVVDRDRDVVLRFQPARVAGKVVEAHRGAAVPDVMVIMRQLRTDGSYGSSFGGPTDEDGRFELANLAAGSYHLDARRDGYEPLDQTLEVPAGAETTDMRLQLVPSTGLELGVRLASGKVPSFVTVRGRDATGRAYLETRATGGADRISFTTLPAGRWELLVHGEGGATRALRAVVPGPPQEVILPDAGRLIVRVPALVERGDGEVSLVGADGRLFTHLNLTGSFEQAWPMIGGRAIVEGVPAGSWQVIVRAGDGQIWTDHAVTTGGPEVLFELR